MAKTPNSDISDTGKLPAGPGSPLLSLSENRVPHPDAPTVHVNYALPRCGIPAAASFRRWVAATLTDAEHNKSAELSIRIVGIDEGLDLNSRYRHMDYATNVLSFPADLPDGIDLPLLGDLVICAPVVAREAGEQRKPARDHWAHLTVHGTLHLLGFDHVIKREAKQMEALETRILAQMDIPDPYRPAVDL